MEHWDTFAVIVGGAAAALLGLLFVAISIRLNIVEASRELRSRAAQTMVLFGTVLVVAILLGVPGQPLIVFGAELIAVALLSGAGLWVLDRRAATPHTMRRIEGVLDTVSPNTVTSVLLAASGIVLMFGASAGLYVLIAPVIAALAGGLTNAWLFMTRLQD